MRWKPLVFAALVTLTASCVTVASRQGTEDPRGGFLDYQSSCGVRYRIPTTSDDAVLVDRHLSELPISLVQTIASITVRDDGAHFRGRHILPAPAHCHTGNDTPGYARREICFRREFISEETVWHETGHAFHMALQDSKSDFDYEWHRIAGDVYGRDAPKVGATEYPIAGLLSDYGSTDFYEDVAEYVAAFYLAMRADYSAFEFVKHHPDSRYRAKVDLLFRYGFIQKKDYDDFLLRGYFTES